MPSTGTFAGFGAAPRLVSAQAIGSALVRLTFNEPMEAGGATTTPGNYTITPDGGSSARTVSGVAIDGDAPSLSVILTLDGALTSGISNYNVLVAATVTDVAGNPIDPLYDNVDFDGQYTLPEIPSHCDVALSRVPSQFKDSPLMLGLICALADQADPIEQNLIDLETYRSINTSTGVQLDALGDLLGLARNGETDAQYRLYLRAKILANNSPGHPDTLIEILQLLDNGSFPASITYREDPYATSILHLLVADGDQPLGEIFVDFLRQAKANATRVILQFEEDGIALFTWGAFDGDPSPPASSGWDETNYTGSDAGRWAEAVD